ncbi:PREDICTED: uncharacterized protein LOC109360376 isoform X1 [Lupinus angustifolius]|uniref:uncharacterized protein LOC109360376 isoform X1 n=1 Tax=Lupinus angustifolius TaxID=3871 RepID=UPI00092F5DE6|nr:PREDICTED: uncharacterized protein LOC109360376 isoform X1 [Lupinus angustifolius]XP_019460771.1 PREDICTED: uncharacterized protein LOC109360376 isoform X1 [Lupinus angustifolius]XP_019460772.1 PREDICTED: uncharacterized protein LOC109360376 isoform X1 [Lupinus angustifolius]
MLSFSTTISISTFPITIINNNHSLTHQTMSISMSMSPSPSSIHYDTLRVLQWDKLSDLVASFATTSLGRQALKDQLWSLNSTYQQSLTLLQQTNAAVQMNKHGGCTMNFAHIDAMLVKTAIQHARRSIPVNGYEARAIAALLQCADTLQGDLKAAIKQDKDWHTHFMPLTEVIMEFVINRSLVKMIDQVIDEDGSVKDSASPALKQSRQQVLVLERKIQHLMESLIRNEKGETAILEVNNIDGRWCIRVDSGQKTSFKGLLLASGSGVGSTVEPLSAVPLNDELQRARNLVAKAESDVLLALTQKMHLDLDDIENILNSMVQLDVINARATYGLSFGGSSPHIFLPDRGSSSTAEASTRNDNSSGPLPNNRDWTLYLPKAYHPLLLQRHKENVKKHKKDVNLATSDTTLDNAHPVPVDFFVSKKTRVVVITGPNTGGKTICLKTVGLAAMMAKSGLYVLASESVQIPWFDSVFADIGDEQSLSQSLSTFSGHLKQIGNIKLNSTSQSLVLLDEVGAGTNPLEGAALGMSLLESFAQDGCLLTIATTHHGELKTLKYSNDAFENACMEFDDVNLKPTYKILWGVPGRSNAINIAERLGLTSVVVDGARKLYGSASAEIDEVITDMEKLKQDYQELLDEGHHHLMLSRELYNSLLSTRRKIMKHSSNLRYKKMRDVSEAAAMARSILHKKVRQLDASPKKPSQPNKTIKSSQSSATNNRHTAADSKEPTTIADGSASAVKKVNQLSPDRSKLPKVGDMVNVTSLGRKAAVLKVDSSKGEIVVQAGSMKLKLKVTDIQIS